MSKDIPKDLRQRRILSELLIRVRQKADLRQIDLATKLNVHQSYVSKYESGERRIDLIEVKQICDAVGITFKEFIELFEEALKQDNIS